MSSSYLDEKKMIWAPELKQYIVSLVPADFILLFCLLLFLAAFLFIFRPIVLSRISGELSRFGVENRNSAWTTLFEMSAVCYLGFLLLTFFATAAPGVYPLFSGMHRRLFMVVYGDKIYMQIFLKTLTYGALFFGVGQVSGLLTDPWRRWRTWLPSLGWFGMLIFLLILGHRFSSLIWSAYFFILPMSLLFLSRFRSRAGKVFLGLSAFVVCVVTSMFAHSFFVGGFHASDREGYLERRIFIDQAQLWNVTASRIFGFGLEDSGVAEETILRPFFSEAIYNRSAQYLMFRELGGRAYSSWAQDHIITLGFPENVIDIVGSYWIFPFCLGLALYLAGLFYMFFLLLARRQFFGALLLMILLNPVIYFLVGGTANAVFSLKYFVKFFFVFGGFGILRSQQVYRWDQWLVKRRREAVDIP